MAKRTLKVFRTSIGFEDAYVAAPSRRAALAAWGTNKDLFARGAAEQVDDPDLGKTALAQPGVIVRVPKGTLGQHLSAGAQSERALAGDTGTDRDQPRKRAARPRKRPPPPSRTALDRTRDALSQSERDYAANLSDLERQIAALQQQRRDLREQHDRDLADLQADIEREVKAYNAALKKWEQGTEGDDPPAR